MSDNTIFHVRQEIVPESPLRSTPGRSVLCRTVTEVKKMLPMSQISTLVTVFSHSDRQFMTYVVFLLPLPNNLNVAEISYIR